PCGHHVAVDIPRLRGGPVIAAAACVGPPQRSGKAPWLSPRQTAPSADSALGRQRRMDRDPRGAGHPAGTAGCCRSWVVMGGHGWSWVFGCIDRLVVAVSVAGKLVRGG